MSVSRCLFKTLGIGLALISLSAWHSPPIAHASDLDFESLSSRLKSTYASAQWSAFFGTAQAYRQSWWADHPAPDLVILEVLGLIRLCHYDEADSLAEGLRSWMGNAPEHTKARETLIRLQTLTQGLRAHQLAVKSAQQSPLQAPKREIIWPTKSSSNKGLPPTLFRVKIEDQCGISSPASNPQGTALLAQDALSAETQAFATLSHATTLIAHNEFETAGALLLKIFETPQTPEQKFDAALLLSAFPPGTSTYAKRSFYTRFALDSPLAQERLGSTDRSRLLRSEALGWFASARWPEANKAFATLAKTESATDRAIAELHLGWIELNLKQPGQAFRRWIATLRADAPLTLQWRLPILRDLAQAWAENGGGNSEDALAIELLLQTQEDKNAFSQGLRTGLTNLSPETLSQVESAPKGPLLSRLGHDIMIQANSLVASGSCGIVPWLDSPVSLEGASRTPTIKMLTQCWRLGEAQTETQRKALAQKLEWAKLEKTQGDARMVLAEVTESLQDFSAACQNYLDVALNAATPETTGAINGAITGASRSCKKGGTKALAQAQTRIPLADVAYRALVDQIIAAKADPLDRQKILEIAYPEPNHASATGRLAWLELLETPPAAGAATPNREHWVHEIATRLDVWSGLGFRREDIVLLQIKISIAHQLWAPLWERADELEKVALPSPNVAAAYQLWLEELTLQALNGKLTLSAPPARTLAQAYYQAVQSLQALPSPPQCQPSPFPRKSDLLRSPLLSTLQAVEQGFGLLETSIKIPLKLSSPNFVLQLKKKIVSAQKAVARLRLAAKNYAWLQDRISPTLQLRIGALQASIGQVESPTQWPENERKTWTAQRELIGQEIEGWKKL